MYGMIIIFVTIVYTCYSLMQQWVWDWIDSIIIVQIVRFAGLIFYFYHWVVITKWDYNPGQKVLGHLPFFTWFCMEFAANLRYTLINTALTRFSPHPPLNKVEVHKVYKICKRCLTCNTQHCSGGEGGQLELHFPHLKRKGSQTFWPGL